jgi:hypothetical protein
MPLRVTIPQVNRFLFRKQHLTPETRARDVTTLAHSIGPIRATPATTLYISAWARVADFQTQHLDEALYQTRTLTRIHALQARLYAVPTRDLNAYFCVSRPLLRLGLGDLDALLYSASNGRKDDLDADIEVMGHPSSHQLAQRVLEIMSTQGSATIDELAELLPELRRRIPHDPENPELGYSLLGTRLIPAMCAEGMLVRAETRGGWRSDFYSYATMASWLPGMDLEPRGCPNAMHKALRHVVRAYVRAYGPVTIGDVQQWLGGHPRRQIMSALMRLPGLTSLEIEGSQGDYVLFEDQLAALFNPPEEEPAAALLPPRDALPTAYSDPMRFLAQPYAERVYDRAGEALGTVWLDGQIIGTWWLHNRDQRITIRFFEQQGPETLALVGEEARRLVRLLEFSAPELDIGCLSCEEETDLASFPVLVHGMLFR